MASEEQLEIAHLQAQVTALEAALARRSRELRLIQTYICRRDLILVSRLVSGFPPLPFGAYEPAFWQETTELTGAHVEETLIDLWRSLAPLPETLDEPA
jgi:hypothetical protein